MEGAARILFPKKKCVFLRFFLFSFSYLIGNFTERQPWELRENSLRPPIWKKCVLLRFCLNCHLCFRTQVAIFFCNILQEWKKSSTFAVESPTLGLGGGKCPLSESQKLSPNFGKGFDQRPQSWLSGHIKKAFIDALFWRYETSQLSNQFRNLATIDVLRDIDDPSVPIWYVVCVYTYAHTRTLTI